MHRQFFTVCVVVLVFSLWALVKAAGPFQLPNKGVARPSFLVDETGQVLLGSTPANVNLTNSEPILVKLVSPEEKVLSFFVTIPTCPGAVDFFTVPDDKSFILTDVEGSPSRVLVAGTIRLETASNSSSFHSGVFFEAGETLQVCSLVGGGGRVTLMGTRIASS